MKARFSKLHRIYGKHVLLIESLIILVLTLTFIVQIFLPANYIIFSVPIWLISLFAVIFVHHYIIQKLIKKESHPYELLRLKRIRLYLLKGVTLFTFISPLLLYLIAVFVLFPNLPTYSNIAEFFIMVYKALLFMELMAFFFLIIFPISSIAYLLYLGLGAFSNTKEARLSLRAAIIGFALIRKEKAKEKKLKLARNYLRLFKDAIRSYNKYLYKITPIHLEIVDIDDYYCSAFNASIIGNQVEQELVIRQFRIALSCIPGRDVKGDLRRFLTSLRNIKNIESNDDYPLTELNAMTKSKSFSQKLREKIASPYFGAIVGVIPIILSVLSILHIL